MRSARSQIPGGRLVNPEDVVGDVFGRLTVIRLISKEPYRTSFRYLYACLCVCGRIISRDRRYLLDKTRLAQSCGCLKQRSTAWNWNGCGGISGNYWYTLQQGALKRNILFTLTIEQAWVQFQQQQGCCALTGIPLSFEAIHRQKTQKTASLDRIDNSKGYEVGNVQWVHKSINHIRGSLGIPEFIDWCRKISLYQGKDRERC